MISCRLKLKPLISLVPRLPRFLVLPLLLATALTTANSAAARQAQDDSPRELSGMSASTSFNVKDDLPLDLQAETAISMLYRLAKASPTTLDRFAAYTRDVSLTQARDETIDYRFWLFRFSATLKKIEKVSIVDAPNTSDSIQHLYRCTAEVTDASGESLHCTILTRMVPSQLPTNTEIATPIECTGLLYCRALTGLAAEGSTEEAQSEATESSRGNPNAHVHCRSLGLVPKDRSHCR